MNISKKKAKKKTEIMNYNNNKCFYNQKESEKMIKLKKKHKRLKINK